MKKIHCTMNYKLFKKNTLNRTITATAIFNLVLSIKERNLLSTKPILVNDQFEVVDGHTRLMAAERLQVPIYYIVEPNITLDCMMLANSAQTRWGVRDTIRYYASQKKQDYIFLKSFMDETGLMARPAASILVGSSSGVESTAMRKGEWEHGITADDYAKFLKQYLDLRNILDSRADACIKRVIKNQSFCSCLGRLFRNSSYSHERLCSQLRNWWTRLRPQVSQDDYRQMLQNLYNYKQKDRLTIK